MQIFEKLKKCLSKKAKRKDTKFQS